MPHQLYQVDAFTEEPFRGNPAVVCLLEAPESETWMQSLAAEMNLSETAFLLPEGTAWLLRWFTPTTEVNLCGHATLASAYVIFTQQPALRQSPITFNSRSGQLRARWKDGKVELDFPVMHYGLLKVAPEIEGILGFEPVAAVYSGDYYLFEAKNPKQVLDAAPDFTALASLPMPEVMITAPSADPQFDFISRFFAPQLGINEDPVTGSAHCLLSPYWANKLGKSTLKAFQASQRGGILEVMLQRERVFITGAAKLIFEGQLLV